MPTGRRRWNAGCALMSFVVQCLYCRYPARVPALGPECGLRCRQCAGTFMLVPRRAAARVTMLAPAEPAAIALAAPDESLEVMPLPEFEEPALDAEEAAVAAPTSIALHEQASVALMDTGIHLGPPTVLSALDLLPEPSPAPRPRPISDDDFGSDSPHPPTCLLIGVGAMFLGIAALFCASLFGLPWLVISLSAIGALAGLGALVVAWADQQNWLLPGGGAVVSALMLLAALFAPGLFGPNYLAGYQQQKAASDPAAIQVVLLRGQKPAADLVNPEWIDASRAGLKQGGLTVEVAGVELASADSLVFRNPAKDAKKKYLIVRLRIHRIVGGREFAAEKWFESGDHERSLRLALSDAAGKTYPQLDLDLKAGTSTQAAVSGAFPITLANPGFVFEAPAADVKTLRLEAPLATLGGVNSFRFTIPRSMIQDEPAPATPALNQKGVSNLKSN
jgi:hypothetical protein